MFCVFIWTSIRFEIDELVVVDGDAEVNRIPKLNYFGRFRLVKRNGNWNCYTSKNIKKKQFQTTTTTRKPHPTKQLWNSKNETTLSKLKVDNVAQVLDIIATHSLPHNSLENTPFCLSTSLGNRQSFYVSSFFSFRYSQQTSIEHPHRAATSVCAVYAMEQWNRIVF